MPVDGYFMAVIMYFWSFEFLTLSLNLFHIYRPMEKCETIWNIVNQSRADWFDSTQTFLLTFLTAIWYFSNFSARLPSKISDSQVKSESLLLNIMQKENDHVYTKNLKLKSRFKYSLWFSLVKPKRYKQFIRRLFWQGVKVYNIT